MNWNGVQTWNRSLYLLVLMAKRCGSNSTAMNAPGARNYMQLLNHYRLSEEGQDAIGTLCGGDVTVFVQTYFPPPQLVIVGGGHIGRPLKIMGEAAGFEVVVVDVVPGRETVPELDPACLTTDSYVVLITTDHVSDEAALRAALKSQAPYG